jgi:hypothetical protein
MVAANIAVHLLGYVWQSGCDVRVMTPRQPVANEWLRIGPLYKKWPFDQGDPWRLCAPGGLSCLKMLPNLLAWTHETISMMYSMRLESVKVTSVL